LKRAILLKKENSAFFGLIVSWKEGEGRARGVGGEGEGRGGGGGDVMLRFHRKKFQIPFSCKPFLLFRSRRTVSVLLSVQYAPGVQLTASRDPVLEGDTVTFNCLVS